MDRKFFIALPVTLAMIISLESAFLAEAETISTRRVASGLSQPLFATFAPGDRDRLFILEKGDDTGTAHIRIVNLTTGAINADPFLTITGLTTDGERGLLGLAFAPDYQSSGEFYVNATRDAGAITVSRYSRTSADVADPIGHQFLTIPHPGESNHNGGWMGFSPNDGNLYISTADGGGSNDPSNNAQNTSVLLGKMLRIDVSGTGLTRPYAVPASNPFAGAIAGADEIWAYGLRNAWRNSSSQRAGKRIKHLPPLVERELGPLAASNSRYVAEPDHYHRRQFFTFRPRWPGCRT